MSIRVLIIEDEKLIRWSLRQKFESKGFSVTEAANRVETDAALHDSVHDLIMLDYKLPDTTGIDILRRIREADADVVVIMMTAYTSVETAVEAIKLGAYDYVAKPFDMDEVLLKVDKALETTRLRREVRELRRHVHHEYDIRRIIGRHPCMRELFDVIERVASSGASTVFLRGETGTGKDLVARVIHYSSDRASSPFMNITCTALSETLLESELFGHERGAFTDAKATKKGLFELAEGGTIFLDEVGDMPLGLQAKLLRFLEERAFRRVGGSKELSVDVRVIAATNRDIEAAVASREFRSDLMFRLDVVPIYLPPLRERGDDVRLLADHFGLRFAEEFKKPVTQIEEDAYRKLLHYPWPGNVRELRNVMERAVLLSRGDTLSTTDIVLGRAESGAGKPPHGGFRLPTAGVDLREVQRSFIRQALEQTNGDVDRAAKLLGMKPTALRRQMTAPAERNP
jgi:DNA-binding NtrC family response regulator